MKKDWLACLLGCRAGDWFESFYQKTIAFVWKTKIVFSKQWVLYCISHVDDLTSSSARCWRDGQTFAWQPKNPISLRCSYCTMSGWQSLFFLKSLHVLSFLWPTACTAVHIFPKKYEQIPVTSFFRKHLASD